MAKDNVPNTSAEFIEVDLRQPGLAAFWGWLWPGAGHLYQRRYAKGILFMVCILSIYFFGLAICGGHAVYASWRPNDRRWQYACQLGIGIPALPALVQAQRAKSNRKPLWEGFMAPPRDVDPNRRDELAEWYEDYNTFFELGTLYTMIAGLLNVLAIYDAYAGPFLAVPDEAAKKRPPPDDAQR